ncbi:MAG: hypothetical protein QXO94_03750 [Candidatus Bathyarchaeia archaeon]
MGYRWRRMYYATGLPGWIRFGYSPGWIGRSPTGLLPTAEWILSSGLMPQFRQWIGQGMGAVPPIAPPLAPAGATITKEQEIQMLDQQAKAIEAQLETTRKRLEFLRQKPETQGQLQP